MSLFPINICSKFNKVNILQIKTRIVKLINKTITYNKINT